MALNPIKRGFLAREVVITTGDGKETLEEFRALAERVWECDEPVGFVEESLVQTIATCWWRKARVIRAENGEIRSRLDTLAADRALRNSDKGNLDLVLMQMDFGLYNAENPADVRVSTRARWSAMQGAQSELRGHHSGLAYLSALLKQAKSELASDGHISEKIREKILFAFCFWNCVFALATPVPQKRKWTANHLTALRTSKPSNSPISSHSSTID